LKGVWLTRRERVRPVVVEAGPVLSGAPELRGAGVLADVRVARSAG
jgi:hypothetical protein